MDATSTAPGRMAFFPVKTLAGDVVMTVVQKVSFLADARGLITVDEEGPEPDLIDTYNGDDAAASSIRRPSQLFDHKPGTDVLLLGHAHPPQGGSATSMNVSLKVGPVDKTVRIRGFSVFQRGSFGGVVPGPARPLKEPVPLIYELAYGGCDVTNPERPVAEPRNPVGRGVAREINDVVGHPANQLEHPSDPRAPACFGAIHRHWQPRASFAGTYDAAWMETRMPLLPTDFDPRFHVSVPPDQWSESPLRGDEPIEVLGVTPEGSWRFQLPRLAIGFSSVVRGRRSEHRTYLDTVLVDADARRIELTWRASVPLPPKWEDVEKILVFEKSVL